MKNIRVFHLKIFQFLEVKFSTYLNRLVFVMHPEKGRKEIVEEMKDRDWKKEEQE